MSNETLNKVLIGTKWNIGDRIVNTSKKTIETKGIQVSYRSKINGLKMSQKWFIQPTRGKLEKETIIYLLHQPRCSLFYRQ